MKNSLIIHYHGEIKYLEEENNILISEDASLRGDFINKQLQIDYLKIEDYIKEGYPFILATIFALICITYFPIITLFLPNLLM